MAGDDDVIPIRSPEILCEVGGPVDECRLTLGIHGDDLDPDEITRLLGCAPTRSHRRGDVRKRSPPAPSGAWLLSVEAKEPEGPEELVERLFAHLPKDENVWASVRERFAVRLGFAIFTSAWNRGFDLSPEAVSRIRELGIGVGFSISMEGE